MRFLFFLLASFVIASLKAEETDVLVYGATPAGIAAAIAAASDGERVLLVESTDRIGGMITCGLSHADFRTLESLSGTYLEFTHRVEAQYLAKYGPDSQQVRDCFRGNFAEPKVNLVVFEQMLAAQPKITVWRNRRLFNVRSTSEGDTRAIGMAAFLDESNATISVSADVFIDATYEGDLMAAAKAPYRVGKEGRAEFGESLAPERPDNRLQAYNFRLCMTQDPRNLAPIPRPEGYDRKEFAGVIPLLKAGKIERVFGYPSGCIFKAQTPALPNEKFDINDVSQGLVRLSLPGENLDWPDGPGGAAVRAGPPDAVEPEVPFSPTALGMSRSNVFANHLLWNTGLLYFLQRDEAVPAKFREEALSWGLCRDEFESTAHLPPQLYVREARRLEGQVVFSEKDTEHANGDARALLHSDAIAIGDHGPNCHGTGHEGSRFGGKHTGEFYKVTPPYQIPYGVLIARDVENLLVPVACSASHVGFCALRFEPIWMSLGQAAGRAAHLAREGRTVVQRVNVARLQERLHTAGSATIYVSDMPPGHADFAAVQWWGTSGGFHGLATMPDAAAVRGMNIHGQYFEAFPDHAAQLDLPLDAALGARWQALASKLSIDAAKLPKVDGTMTRGAWLRAAWAAR